MSLRFNHYQLAFDRVPFVRPFHLKGGYFTEKWLNATRLRSTESDDSSDAVTGIGGNAVLWSDASVFYSHSETGGNILMAAMAEKAAQIAKGQSFEEPVKAIKELIPELHRYGAKITGRDGLNPTFTLNALVSLDMALWKLFARENGITVFDELIPAKYGAALSESHSRLIHMPSVTYNLPLDPLVELAKDGRFVMKVKLGHAGSQSEMIEKDVERLDELQRTLRGYVDNSDSGRMLRFVLDPNGRYESKEALLRLLERIDAIGLTGRVVMIEEPFPEKLKIDVTDIPARIAADESVHDEKDVIERIEQGYTAIALKPAGKTLSMSLLMADAAWRYGVPCFVADSACVPLLVEWNKNFAARLPALPEMPCGILESNGRQNYGSWHEMVADLPEHGSWVEPDRGIYHLGDSYYTCSGGILEEAGKYEALFNSV